MAQGTAPQSLPRFFLLGLNGITTPIMGSPTRASEITLHISGTWTATLQPKSFLPGNGLTSADRQPIPYRGKTGTPTDPTATGITTNGIYRVPLNAGEMFILECTAFTSGSATIDAFVSPLA